MKKSNERVLVFYDKNKASRFETEVENVQSEADRLITVFEAFQPWKRITILEDFIVLVTDPQGLYDKTLQNNSGIDTKATGGKLPAPDMVAKMLDLEYDNYRAVITGKKVSESCKPCNSKAKIIKVGSGVLDYRTFQTYQKFLIWGDDNRFSIDETAVDKKKQEFEIYAVSKKQIDTYFFWHNACDTLNELSKRGLLGEPNAFSKLLGGRITYSFQAYKFSVDEQSLLYEIDNIKN